MRKLGLLIVLGVVVASHDARAAPRDGAAAREAPAVRDAFAVTASLAQARAQHAAALLPDGRVLIAGGRTTVGAWLQSAELYDPDRAVFTPTSPTLARYDTPQLTRLRDGRILLSGGAVESSSRSLRVEYYDPATERFVPGGSGTLSAYGHSATLLDDGRVLLSSGTGAEVFDPESDSFTPVVKGTFLLGSSGRPAARLADGRVLFAGGPAPSSGGGQHAYAELFLAETNAFVRTGAMAVGRGELTLTALRDGTAIAIGGFQSYGGLRVDVYATAEIYDPATETFGPGGTMRVGRSAHTATLLDDGRVLVAGNGAEVYDPDTRTFALTAGAPVVERWRSSTTLLQDGRVLIVGGEDRTSSQPLASAELYTPLN